MYPKGSTLAYKVNFSQGEEGRRSKREKPKKFNRREFIEHFPLDEWTCSTGRTVFSEEKFYDDNGAEILNYHFNTWYDRVRFPNWFPCPYHEPSIEDLEDKRLRQVVMEWFLDPTNQRWNPDSDL